MAARSRIEAKVARILTARELVLNKGEVDGVSVGMRFAILNSNGENIVDPDSGESLGSVELEKTMVKVVRVSDRLSVARTFRTFRTSGGAFSNSLLALTAPAKTVYETLETDEQRLKDELSEEESYVKIGDRAVEARGDEYEDE